MKGEAGNQAKTEREPGERGDRVSGNFRLDRGVWSLQVKIPCLKNPVSHCFISPGPSPTCRPRSRSLFSALRMRRTDQLESVALVDVLLPPEGGDARVRRPRVVGAT